MKLVTAMATRIAASPLMDGWGQKQMLHVALKSVECATEILKLTGDDPDEMVTNQG